MSSVVSGGNLWYTGVVVRQSFTCIFVFVPYEVMSISNAVPLLIRVIRYDRLYFEDAKFPLS
jgi:hypothetical protein